VAFLSATIQPSGAVDGVAFTTQPVIQLMDGSGNPEALADVTVTASKNSGSGTLVGTLTAVTNGSGVATFTDLAIQGTGDHQLLFSAAGYSGILSDLTVSGAAGHNLGGTVGRMLRLGRRRGLVL
jgi:hypothetical protein